MSEVWVIWCDGASYRRICDEVVSRLSVSTGRDARFARVDGGEDAVALARAMGADVVNIAIEVTEARLEECETAISALAREGVAGKITALVESPDPGMIARCFMAGANEVIAASDAENHSESVPDVRARKGCLDVRSAPTLAADDMTGVEEPVPYRAGGGPSWDELDEPDGMPRTPVSHGGDCGAPDAGVPRVGAAAPSVPRTPERASASGSAGGPQTVASQGHVAPLVAVVSGRGGVGKTTLVASMAVCAARTGLRVAVVDLDLMFGNMHELFGVNAPKGFEELLGHAGGAVIGEDAVEKTAMRIGPGLTLWGPCQNAELSELCSAPIEELVGVLRGLADVVLVDTSDYWGDAVAMAVAACDRCLVVGGKGANSAASGRRAVELVARLGVPHTRMTCLFNRFGAKGCGEEQALAFELGTTLSSRVRIADGGEEVAGMLSFGHVDGLVAGAGPYAQGIRLFTGSLLGELGYPMARKVLEEECKRVTQEGQRFHLPWQKRAGEVA